MQNELTTVPVLYQAGQPLQQITPQQAAWLNVVEMKNKAFGFFNSAELAAQQVLLAVQNSEDQPAIAEALANFNKKVSELEDARLPYTNKIKELLIDPAMVFAKRLKELPLLATLKEKELNLRLDAQKKANDANNKAEEQSRFTLHITNEYLRIETKYKQDLWNEVMGYYKTCLAGKVPLVDMLPLYTVMDQQIAPDAIVRYGSAYPPPYLNSTEEFTVLFNNIKAPNYAAILQQAKESAQHQFANYQSDLQNAPAAIEHANQVQAQGNTELEQSVKQEAAINTLTSTAATPVITGPKIKENLKITVVENEGWLVLVMSTFLAKRAEMMKYVRVKSVSALTIKQMAEAIAKWSSEKEQLIEGFIYEVEKK